MGLKKCILLLLIFLISLNFVSAVPPVTTIAQFPAGYLLVESAPIPSKVNTDYSYHFFILNSSTGAGINSSGINCSFFLADNQGMNLKAFTPYWNVSKFWSVDIAGGNFSRIGYYKYGLRCSDGVGGALTGYLKITPLGYEETMESSIVAISLLVLFILFDLFIFYLIFSISPENKRNEVGDFVGISFIKYVRMFLIGISYGLILLTLNLMNASAAQVSSIPQFSGIIGGLFDMMLRGVWIWTILVFLKILVMLIKDSNFNKYIKKMGNPI